MRLDYTAIIYLRQPIERCVREVVEPKLQISRGVDHVSFEPGHAYVTIEFDHDQTGLADLVRTIEDCGCDVTGVAQHPSAA